MGHVKKYGISYEMSICMYVDGAHGELNTTYIFVL